MTRNLPIVLSGVVADAMTGFLSMGAGTGGAVAGIALSKLFERRLRTGRKILVEQLRKSDKTLNDVAELEEAVAVVYRYSRAAQEGSARLNLRLMAKVVAGQAHRGTLIADEFLYYADILASLRREEVILIASLFRNRVMLPQGSDSPSRLNERETWEKARQQLVPSFFPDEETMHATAMAAARTGLVAAGRTIDGADAFLPTTLLDRLQTLAPFQDALREEDIV